MNRILNLDRIVWCWSIGYSYLKYRDDIQLWMWRNVFGISSTLWHPWLIQHWMSEPHSHRSLLIITYPWPECGRFSTLNQSLNIKSAVDRPNLKLGLPSFRWSFYIILLLVASRIFMRHTWNFQALPMEPNS